MYLEATRDRGALRVFYTAAAVATAAAAALAAAEATAAVDGA